MGRRTIHREQIYVVSLGERGFWIGGELHSHVPWHHLGACHLYALDEDSLEAVLGDAADDGWHVFDGSSSRRGIGGFSVGIGPWGIRGVVECRKLSSWAIEGPELLSSSPDLSFVTGEAQRRLRAIVTLLNETDVPFRPTGLRYLQSIYERYGRLMEPRGQFPPLLPPEVALLCRRAHVGGPILHVQTSLAPWTSVDRTRAYGSALMEDLPSGPPVQVALRGSGLVRWAEDQLMGKLAILDATVRVEPGPLVPLLPVMKWSPASERARAIYPTGSFRGAFTSVELAHLERSGRGRVEQLHRAYVFERGGALGHVVGFLRRLEREGLGDLCSVKRLEHMLYGSCSRGLSFSRFGSASRHREPRLRELIDGSTLDRLTTRVELRPMGRRTTDRPAVSGRSNLRLFEIRGTLSSATSPGSSDRPDRSAWITAMNRISVADLVSSVDRPGERSGSRIGRIYVDGVDLEGRPEELSLPPGWTVRGTGSRIRILRSTAVVRELDDGSIDVDDGGILPPGSKPDEGALEQALRVIPELDSGAFASGRYWRPVQGEDDPRLVPGQVSEPVDLADGTYALIENDESQ